MKDIEFKVISNTELVPDVYEMILEGDSSDVTTPGQFINIKLEGFYLRRPISICDWSDNTLTLLYKIVGEGTKVMAEMEPGDTFMALVPLGNGFDMSKGGDSPSLVGGGLATPVIHGLAKHMVAMGKHPKVCLGFNSKEAMFYTEKFEKLGVDIKIATLDGSVGTRGLVTDIVEKGAYVLTCGPEPMLEAVYKIAGDGQFDFGARMACGFGACMGCSCETKYGSKRICKDGPILEKEEIIW